MQMHAGTSTTVFGCPRFARKATPVGGTRCAEPQTPAGALRCARRSPYAEWSITTCTIRPLCCPGVR